MFLKNKRMANRYLRIVVISGERGRGIEWKRGAHKVLRPVGSVFVQRGSVYSFTFYFFTMLNVHCKYSLTCIKHCIVIFKKNWNTIISSNTNKSLLVLRM